MSKFRAYNYVTRRTERVTDQEFNSGPYRPIDQPLVRGPRTKELLFLDQNGRLFRVLAEELPDDSNADTTLIPVKVYSNGDL